MGVLLVFVGSCRRELSVACFSFDLKRTARNIAETTCNEVREIVWHILRSAINYQESTRQREAAKFKWIIGEIGTGRNTFYISD